MGSGFSKMKKQAKLLEQQMTKMREDMQEVEVTGIAGNGLVKVVMNGEKEVKKVSIQPECVDPSDVEGLEDLLLAAFQDARRQIDEKVPSSPLEGLGGLNLGF